MARKVLYRVRDNSVMQYKLAKKEYDNAKIYHDKAYAKLLRSAKAVLRLYVPLKNAVSDNDWSSKKITRVKLANKSKNIELTLIDTVNGVSKETYWKFPSWMMGADKDKVVEGLQQQIEEQGKKYK